MSIDYRGMVYVVEDDDGMADLYGELLDSISLIHRRFSRGDAFLAEVQPDWWGAVILDLRLPGQGGMEILRKLCDSDSALSVIVVTGYGEIRSAVDAIQWGAANFLEKPFSNPELLANVERMVKESRARYAQRERRRDQMRRVSALSPRERQIANLVTRGLTSKEIAAELQISARTVEVHRASILDVLECDNSVEMAKLMLEIQQELPGLGDEAATSARSSASAA
jgi:FixJ family two-component response regulator